MECRIVESPEAARRRAMQQKQMQQLLTPIIIKHGKDAVLAAWNDVKGQCQNETPHKIAATIQKRIEHRHSHRLYSMEEMGYGSFRDY